MEDGASRVRYCPVTRASKRCTPADKRGPPTATGGSNQEREVSVQVGSGNTCLDCNGALWEVVETLGMERGEDGGPTATGRPRSVYTRRVGMQGSGGGGAGELGSRELCCSRIMVHWGKRTSCRRPGIQHYLRLPKGRKRWGMRAHGLGGAFDVGATDGPHRKRKF